MQRHYQHNICQFHLTQFTLKAAFLAVPLWWVPGSETSSISMYETLVSGLLQYKASPFASSVCHFQLFTCLFPQICDLCFHSFLKYTSSTCAGLVVHVTFLHSFKTMYTNTIIAAIMAFAATTTLASPVQISHSHLEILKIRASTNINPDAVTGTTCTDANA